MPNYDLIYEITKFSNSDNISRQTEEVVCVVCNSRCHWFNHDLSENLCSTECEMKLFEDRLNGLEDYQFYVRYSSVDSSFE